MQWVIQGVFRVSLVALGAVLGMALAATTSDVQAASARVRAACAGDYLRLCSRFSPNSQETRDCMDENGSKLSKYCVNALIEDGEVSAEEVASRAAARRAAERAEVAQQSDDSDEE